MGRKVNSHPELFPLPPNANQYKWVDREVVGTCSELTTNNSVEQSRAILLPCPGDEGGNDYGIFPVGTNERICTMKPEENPGFYFYEEVITKIGIRMPFTDFEMGVLRTLRIAPSQLHPNGWAFVRVFQLVCSVMGWQCTLRIFFYLFSPQANAFEKGLEKRPWVSLKARNGYSLFTKYSESWKTFKPFYFKYRYLGNSNSWFMRAGEEQPIPYFPLHWTQSFFQHSVKSYSTDWKDLCDSEKQVCRQYKEYLEKNGMIVTKEIVNLPESEIKDKLVEMADRLAKIAKGGKKRKIQTVKDTSGSSTPSITTATASGSSIVGSPRPSVNLSANPVTAEHAQDAEGVIIGEVPNEDTTSPPEQLIRRRRLNKGKAVAVDCSSMEPVEEEEEGGDVICSVWDRKLDEKFPNFICTEQDQDNLSRLSANEWGQHMSTLTKFLLRGACITHFLFQRKDDVYAGINNEQKEARVLTAAKEARLFDELLRVRSQLENLRADHSELVKEKNSLKETENNACTESEQLKKALEVARQKNGELMESVNRLTAEAEKQASISEKLRGQALKHKKAAATNSFDCEKGVYDSFLNAVKQNQYLNANIDLRVIGAYPFHAIKVGKMIDLSDKTEVDLGADNLPNPLIDIVEEPPFDDSSVNLSDIEALKHICWVAPKLLLI